MKNIFPHYVTSISCALSAKAVNDQILKRIGSQKTESKILEIDCTDVQKIVFSVQADQYIFFNSFLPITNIDIKETDGKADVFVLFELQKSTKRFLFLLWVIAILFEIVLLVLWLMKQTITPVPLFFPIVLIIWSYCLSSIGLYFSSRNIMRSLFPVEQ